MSTQDAYSAELWTRGAPWDQTRIYFDGFPLFNPLHAVGVFSGVNTDAIGAAFLHPGVSPTSIGGGAAGTLDLRSRKGSSEGGLNGLGELSLASGRLALDGAFADGRHQWMVAGRRTYLDWLTSAIEKLSGSDDPLSLPYSFVDLASRYDYRIDEDRALEVSTLLELDRITGDIPDVLHRTAARWGSGIARATLELPFRGLRTRHTLGFSGFESRIRRLEEDPDREFGFSAPEADPSSNHVRYYALSGGIEPPTSSAAVPRWSAGYQVAGQTVRFRGPRPAFYERLTPADSAVMERENHLAYGVLWAERRWMPSEALTIGTGLRLEAGPAVRNGGMLRWAPRTSARYQLIPALSISAAYGRTYQYTQSVAAIGPDAIEGFRTGHLWVLAGDSTPVIHTDIATLGAESWIGSRWLGSVTAYLRRSTGLAIPDPTPGSARGRPLFVTGENRARGIELSARRLTGRWTASIAYSYGVSEMLAAGLRFPAPADQRHVLDATALARLGWGWRLGAAYTAATGTPYTRQSLGRADCVSQPECVWTEEPWIGEPGAYRAPAYRSLDLLVDWTHGFGTWSLGAYLQLRNALDRENMGRYLRFNPRYCPSACGTENGVEFGWQEGDQFLPGLPRLPLIGLRVTF